MFKEFLSSSIQNAMEGGSQLQNTDPEGEGAGSGTNQSQNTGVVEGAGDELVAVANARDPTPASSNPNLVEGAGVGDVDSVEEEPKTEATNAEVFGQDVPADSVEPSYDNADFAANQSPEPGASVRSSEEEEDIYDNPGILLGKSAEVTQGDTSKEEAELVSNEAQSSYVAGLPIATREINKGASSPSVKAVSAKEEEGNTGDLNDPDNFDPERVDTNDRPLFKKTPPPMLNQLQLEAAGEFIDSLRKIIPLVTDNDVKNYLDSEMNNLITEMIAERKAVKSARKSAQEIKKEFEDERNRILNDKSITDEERDQKLKELDGAQEAEQRLNAIKTSGRKNFETRKLEIEKKYQELKRELDLEYQNEKISLEELDERRRVLEEQKRIELAEAEKIAVQDSADVDSNDADDELSSTKESADSIDPDFENLPPEAKEIYREGERLTEELKEVKANLATNPDNTILNERKKTLEKKISSNAKQFRKIAPESDLLGSELDTDDISIDEEEYARSEKEGKLLEEEARLEEELEKLKDSVRIVGAGELTPERSVEVSKRITEIGERLKDIHFEIRPNEPFPEEEDFPREEEALSREEEELPREGQKKPSVSSFGGGARKRTKKRKMRKPVKKTTKNVRK